MGYVAMFLSPFMLAVLSVTGNATLTRQEAAQSLDRAIAFYSRLDVQKNWKTPGGYAWSYSLDLSKRWGRQDQELDPTKATAQEPATPSVGFVFLHAFRETGRQRYLELAERVGDALILGQLKDGGWIQDIDYECKLQKTERGTFKEGKTQVAIQFLIELAADTKNSKYEMAARRGLDYVLAAQFKSGKAAGAWPMTFPLSTMAMMPSGWTPPEGFEFNENNISFNDGGGSTCAETLMIAYHAYRDSKFLDAAKLFAEFCLRAQNADDGWCQHYHTDLTPAWGRGKPDKQGRSMSTGGEPPGNDDVVTADIVRMLALLFVETGDKRCLDASVRGAKWLKRIRRNSNEETEYYEIGSFLPLGIVKNKKGIISLTHELSDDSYRVFTGDNIPVRFFTSNYYTTRLYKHPSRSVDVVELLKQTGRLEKPSAEDIATRTEQLAKIVGIIVKNQKEDGRWLDDFEIPEQRSYMYDEPRTRSFSGNRIERMSIKDFVRNAEYLCDYLKILREANPVQ